MPIDLTQPLRWKTADAEAQAMLDDLQGNILDGHGRRATRMLFLRFGNDTAAARAMIRRLAPLVTSAGRQLAEAETFRRIHVSGGPFVGLLLSAAGYAALGVAAKAPAPDDDGAFHGGMASRAGRLNDTAADVEQPYRGRIDAMILIAGDPDGDASWDSNATAVVETQVLNLLHGAATVVATEIGRALFKDNGIKHEGIEHFGYVDGRSQPLMLEELIERERDGTDGTSVWNPAFPFGQALVRDPGSALATAYGSFFVFRKLEQNVARLKQVIERDLGHSTGLGELAGAMIVGRFEDGTPVVLQRGDGMHDPVANNFDYAGDVDGLRCPYHAHIRKVNPRGDTVRELGSTLAEERVHIMVRCGMPFGRRDRVLDPTNEPADGVGLMFKAFQSNLRDQFEFTQASWANNVDFAHGSFNHKPPVGRDPIIGQRGAAAGAPLRIAEHWGDPGAAITPTNFAEFVRFRGGEYFFAPATRRCARSDRPRAPAGAVRSGGVSRRAIRVVADHSSAYPHYRPMRGRRTTGAPWRMTSRTPTPTARPTMRSRRTASRRSR